MRHLLAYRVPDQRACCGVPCRCSVCLAFLGTAWLALPLPSSAQRRQGSQPANLRPLAAVRRALASWLHKFWGGAAINVQIRKNDQVRQGHQHHLGLSLKSRNSDFDVIDSDQLLAFQREAPEQQFSRCPPMFPWSAATGYGFVMDRSPASSDLSRMIMDGLRKRASKFLSPPGSAPATCGLSMAIEAGVLQQVLWMQSEHARQPGAALRDMGCLRPVTRLLHCSALQEGGLSGRSRASPPS